MASSVPYIGSKISLISNAEIRYEGILYTIDTQQATIALSSVRCFGTEGRKMPPLNPSNEVYDFIIFRGQDIKELTVLDSNRAVNDPAIVSINQKPAGRGGAKGGTTGAGKGSQESSDNRSGWGGWGNNSGYGSGGGSSSWGGWNSNNNNYGSGYGSSYNAWNNSGSGSGSGGKGAKTETGKGSGGKRTGDSGKGKSGTKSGKSSGKDGGKDSKGEKGDKGRGKSEKGKGGDKGKGGGEKGSKKGGDKGKRSSGRSGGSGNTGIPVGELAPEENAEVKKECAEDFDVAAANQKFDKVSTIEGMDGFDDRLKPLSGYDKGKSFFDSISCEATERPAESERPKVDREKAREFDKETFGDTRRPPRPAGGRPGKGRRRGGHNGKGFRS